MNLFYDHVITVYYRNENAHQPLPVALITIQIKELDGNGLGRQSGPALIINKPLVDGPEPAFSKEVAG